LSVVPAAVTVVAQRQKQQQIAQARLSLVPAVVVQVVVQVVLKKPPDHRYSCELSKSNLYAVKQGQKRGYCWVHR
jgi:hypothetical protein